ncbi:MAG TPA: acetyl-coenzyme A synthetase N-terminal domain-containing protein, partial [Burkholderiales bacterium]|nr:acetyl-coenzyme A synthetase N-terminal domain-containing protein [Burkholderiales bacterium]
MRETYREFYRRSIEDPNSFWGEQSKLIDWVKPYNTVLNYSRPPFAKWFAGGLTNLCFNAVDRHVP